MSEEESPIKLEEEIPDTETEGQLTEEEQLTPVPDIDYAFKGALSDYVRKFNMYAEILGRKAKSHQPWDIGHRVQESRREVDECVAALEEKILQFAAQIDEFATEVTRYAEPHWYRNVVDLTSYTCRDLESALHDPLAPKHRLEFAPDGHVAGSSFISPSKSSDSSSQTPKPTTLTVDDPTDFATHLRKTLPLIWQPQSRPTGETVADFKTKINCLFDKLTETGRWDINVHAWAWAKYQYGQPGIGLQAISEAADWQMIQGLLHGRTCPELEYWNFAEVYRYLWADYSRCDSAAGRRARGDILRSFYVKAKSEIRTMTSLALTGARPEIPPELAERIIEWTMIAEGLPLAQPDDGAVATAVPPPSQSAGVMGSLGRFTHLT